MIILLCFSLGGTAFSILSSYVGHLEWNTLFSHVSRHSEILGFQTRGMRIVATYSADKITMYPGRILLCSLPPPPPHGGPPMLGPSLFFHLPHGGLPTLGPPQLFPIPPT